MKHQIFVISSLFALMLLAMPVAAQSNIPAITVTPNAIFDVGQSNVLTISITDVGSGNDTYSWKVPSGLNISSGCTNIDLNCTIGSSTSGFYLVTVNATDSNHTQSNDATSSIIVNPVLAVPKVSPSTSQIYDDGQTVTIAAYETGGTVPYTYNFSIFNSITNVMVANQLGPSNSFSFAANDFMVGNAYLANVLVNDNAITHAIVNSINSGTLNFNPALFQPTIFPLVNTIYDDGQSITIATYAAGGTPPYTYNFFLFDSTTNTFNLYSPNNPFNSIGILPSNHTTKAKVQVIDSAASPTSTNSSDSGLFFLNPSLVAGAITPTSPTINSGASVLLHANSSGGTTQYFYAWYTQNGNADTQCNPADIISGANNSTYLVSPASTSSYNYKVTDSATTTVSLCSLPDTVTVLSPTTTSTTTSTTTTSVQTTTIAQNSGQSGSDNQGGSGGGGGGGIHMPTTVRLNSACYLITSIAPLNVFNVSIGGKNQVVTENFISPTNAGITINDISHVLSLLETTTINIGPASSYTVKLLNIWLLPLQNTIDLEMCSSGAQSNLSLESGPNVKLTIFTNATLGDATITNVTDLPPNLPPNLDLLAAFNVSMGPNASGMVNASVNLSCSLPLYKIVPYIYKNGNWIKVASYTVNTTSCSMTFAIPSDPIVALLEQKPAPLALPNSTTTILSTTAQPANTDSAASIQTPQKQTSQQSLPLGAVLGIAIALIVAYLTIVSKTININSRQQKQAKPKASEKRKRK